MRYSTWNNGVPLKSGLGVAEDHGKWYHSIDRIRVPIRLSLQHGPICYRFREKARYWSKISHTYILHNNTWENGCDYICAIFSQRNQICDLLDGGNRFFKKVRCLLTAHAHYSLTDTWYVMLATKNTVSYFTFWISLSLSGNTIG